MQVIRKQTQTRRGKRVVGVAMRLMTGLVAQQKTRIARAVALQDIMHPSVESLKQNL